MSCTIKLERESRKCIKPSTPTPPHLEIFKLSLLDQLSPNIHGNMTLFFYPDHSSVSVTEFSAKSKLLQDSLSRALTLFYPLAGRLRDPAIIHCDDRGAIFIESRTRTALSDILSTPDFDTLQHLLPTQTTDSMLLVRFTLFGCGATALTLSLNHKIVDFASLVTFLKSWTAAACGRTQPLVPDLAAAAALFPPREIPGMSASVNTAAADKFTTRRLVFEASKIEELKNRVVETAASSFQPSRVEVVLALIWRSALLSCRSETAPFRPSALFQAVNLRPRMDRDFPESAIGNLVWAFAVTVEEESELELEALVVKMRECMREFVERKAGRLREEGGFGVVMEELKKKKKREEGMEVYKCTSWCKFGVHEVVDFGWGRPVWMCSVNKMVSNTIALMDTRDGGGVEAFVTLDEGHMPFFQHHHELLRYALLNPSVV